MTKPLNWVLFPLFLLCLSSTAFSFNEGEALTLGEQNNIEVFEKVHRSVVYVTNSQVRQDVFTLNVQEIPAGAGTGFIWDDSGLIVTNFHVIQNADKVRITLDNRASYFAKLVGVAPDKDLALLKIDAPKEKLVPIERGDSDDLQVGRKVLAIGNPFGLDATLTVGVVSALGREIQSVSNRKIGGVIQTDAAINPGNSGGPLLDSQGRLIGVNTQIVSPSGANSGIGFAIPVNIVKKIVPQLLEHGRLIRPTLGVSLLPDTLARRSGIKGVVLVEVAPNGPAGRAKLQGLKRDQRGELILGDVILRFDGEPVDTQDDLLTQLERHKAGDKVKLTLARGNRQIEVEATLAEAQ
ncbi:MAG: 2-alkenal reductase [Candidatus Lambdaproteobacteria bacterium RIFOXYD12_FULL_49_8]|uniref:2-alkenal reductase n=1 Tax=Candidatus Lambdaproteobacteria bacterium RIFOXYD2_FULL_50_16 TaxID=1817772 RepID=A0A1F6G7F3_9PROT|nr:MAG: 2-alkenal reductase [Candidatus Lambdaproteobacteria bacterium RIFOXYD2_FULL_50_16]OGG98399.1 MAG: 2-alkenal reductase [Candidatus Lambdaproteobacteria bacterium RIFOXYD12_FULL_49_8]